MLDGALSWSGACKDGYAEGKGVLEWRGGEKSRKFRLEATLARGTIDGEATLNMADGGKYVGTFSHGAPDGKGYFRDPDGMQYEGEVRNGKRDGVAEGLFPDGDHYQGQWKDGKPDGTGRMEYVLGGAYEGEWKLGKRHGQGTLTYAGSGRRYVGQFVEGRIAGSAPPLASNETYSLKSRERLTGTLFRWDVARGSTIPLNVGYDAFTPEQKRRYNAEYPALEEGDEPPYPLQGREEFYQLMSKLTGKRMADGDLWIFVLVGADGRAQSVSMRGIQDPEVRKFAGTGAGLIQYKPALCRGTPCPMMFALHLRLTLE
jgi:hypothetical protein